MNTIDDYIMSYDGEIRERMIHLRKLIHACHPDIQETIKWGMPTFMLGCNLVHFSAEKNHLGFHPSNDVIDHFKDRFCGYTYSKGTLRISYDQEMPYDLLQEMIEYRIKIVTQ